jgi:site-specific recombinase XerD
MTGALIPQPEMTAAAAAGGPDLLRQLASAVDLLPALPPPDPDDRYHVRNLTVLWLRQLGETSRRSYYQALAGWLGWCARHQVDPLAARRADKDGWQADMTAHRRGPGNTTTTVPPAAATVAKRLACVSSWYRYLADNDLDVRNPALGGRRPTPPARSPLPALASDETVRFLAWLQARAERLGSEAAWRDAALIYLLFATGLRVTAACTATFAHLVVESGHRVLRYRRKSRTADDWDFVPLTPQLLDVLHRYWTVRARRVTTTTGRPVTVDQLTGPLFVSTPHPHQPHRGGDLPVGQKHVQRRLRTLARQAGLDAAATITPHSTRRTATTLLLAAGVPIRRVQDLLGHTSLTTTARYDNNQHLLHTSPVWPLAELLDNTHIPSPAPTQDRP